MLATRVCTRVALRRVAACASSPARAAAARGIAPRIAPRTSAAAGAGSATAHAPMVAAAAYSSEAAAVQTGTVVRWDGDVNGNRYGFVKPDAHRREVYVGAWAITNNTRLREGERVAFTLGYDDEGRTRCENVVAETPEERTARKKEERARALRAQRIEYSARAEAQINFGDKTKGAMKSGRSARSEVRRERQYAMHERYEADRDTGSTGPGVPPDPSDTHLIEQARLALFNTIPTSENPTGLRTGNKAMRKPLKADKMMRWYRNEDIMPFEHEKRYMEQFERESRRLIFQTPGEEVTDYDVIEGVWPPPRGAPRVTLDSIQKKKKLPTGRPGEDEEHEPDIYDAFSEF